MLTLHRICNFRYSSLETFAQRTLGTFQLRGFSQTSASTEQTVRRNIAKMGAVLRAQEEHEYQLCKRLTLLGYTAKELETEKRTGNYNFKIKRDTVPQKSLTKGPWRKEETEILTKMREDRMHPRIIADRLARDEASVRDRIKKFSSHFQERNKAPLYEGPQALSPELVNSIFRHRLSTAWEGLLAHRMTKEWQRVLSSSDPESWIAMIAEHTPEHVKSILASHQPPSIAHLESIKWSPTTAAGVYGWILKPKLLPAPFDDECYLWVGSASKYGGGLEDRRLSLLSSQASTRDEVPKPYIRELGLVRSKTLITLLEIPFQNGSAEEVKRVRTLVVLARELFVALLAAAKDCQAIETFIPWKSEDIRYRGLSSNSLARNIK